MNLRSVEDAVAEVRRRDTMAIPLGPGQPTAFLHALGARHDWEDLLVVGGLLVDLYEVFTHPNVHYRSGFFGPAERFLVASGADVQFVPADFRRFGPLAEKYTPRVVTTLAAPPDAAGYMSLGMHAGATYELLKRAGADRDRVLVVEVNHTCPRTMGLPPQYPHALHVDEADIVIESDRPMFVLPDTEPTDVERAIAGFVSDFVSDGATLQTGIGGVPSAVASLLASGNGGEYGVHSEMFTTGLMHLHRAGKVTNQHKGILIGHSISTFAAGTEELVRWLDGNDEVRFLPVSYVNSPEVISRNRNMVSINGALAIDLYGQAVADSIGGRQFSGIGGHEDFVAASGLSLEDRAILCVPSTVTVDGVVISRILASLPDGWLVTTPRHQLDVVVTEHGAAQLRGATVRERAFALASIAAPEFRDPLLAKAATLG